MNKSITQFIFIVAIICMLMMVHVTTYSQVVNIPKPQYHTTYNLQTSCPQQVSWLLRSTDLGSCKRNPSWRFAPLVHHDLAIAKHDDLRHSGYHRGHLCPAADRSNNATDMKATFWMGNVAPQVPALNTGIWKQTEKWCRNAAITYDSVNVIVVPIFLQRDTIHVGQNALSVPHAFFKAVWLAKNDSVLNSWFIFNK